jgi:hypothetical protein
VSGFRMDAVPFVIATRREGQNAGRAIRHAAVASGVSAMAAGKRHHSCRG